MNYITSIPMNRISFSDTSLGVRTQTFYSIRVRDTVAKDFKKVFEMSEKVNVGLAGRAGLATDIISLLQFRCNLYRFRDHREIKPENSCLEWI